VARCTAHTGNGHISTSYVTVVFVDSDFLEDAQIPAIRVHLRQIWDYLIFTWIIRTSWPKMGVWRQNRGRGGVILIPTNSFLLLGVLTSASFGKNRSRNATVRVLAAVMGNCKN